MINMYNPLHPEESKQILQIDPKSVDIKMIGKLGLKMNERLEIMHNTLLRTETPYTVKAFANSRMRTDEIHKLNNEEFIVTGETQEQTDQRYLFHIFQIEERKKMIVKERNRLKKEAQKLSHHTLHSTTSPLPSQVTAPVDYKNYTSNRYEEQINTIKDNQLKEITKIKANFVSTLEVELHNHKKRNEFGSSSIKASTLKEQSDQEKIKRAQHFNKHASDIGERQKQNEQKFFKQMEMMKKEMSSSEDLKNLTLQRKLKVIHDQQFLKEERESQKQSEVMSRKKQSDQELEFSRDLMFTNLNKKLEHSEYLSGQCLSEKLKRYDKLSFKTESVRNKAQQLEDEESRKKITLAVEKGSVTFKRIDQLTDERLRQQQKTEKIKKNLKSLKELDQLFITRIGQRAQTKELKTDRFLEDRQNLKQEKQLYQQDHLMRCLNRHEKISQDFVQKCDRILEKERYDQEQLFNLTQKRDAFREQMISQSKLDRNKQKDDLSNDLAKFSEKPSKGLLMKSIQKYDLKGNSLIERYFPKRMKSQDI